MVFLVKKDLRAHASLQKKKTYMWFFKTKPGEYGAHDKFLGVITPVQRMVAKRFYQNISLSDIRKLLASSYHEDRACALMMLVYKFEKGDERIRRAVAGLYINNMARVNNWDLVDISADKILGRFLEKKSRVFLYTLARSKNLWRRRIAIVSTFYFIRQGDFKDTLAIIKLLLQDHEDLIHKAAGWMLREVGKRDIKTLEAFLAMYKNEMPRTMLRYAIEKFPERKRKSYLKAF